MKVHSYNEWSRLKEVVVGRGDPGGAPGVPDGPGGERWFDELNEDIELFVEALHGCAITVLRPAPLRTTLDYVPPRAATSWFPALHIRDQAIVFGDEIVETPPRVSSRLFENDLLKPIFYEYFAAGAKWTAMPRPRTTETVSARGSEMTLDATQCLRFGKDVLVNAVSEENLQAARWLRRHLDGRFRLQIMELPGSSRIDSLVLPLRPGTLLVRNRDIAAKLPEPLRKWDIIYSPDPAPGADVNVLSIDESTVIVNSLAGELIRTLEAHGFTVVPVRHRHRGMFGGGFHWFTLDTVRAGKQEDYFGEAAWTPAA